MPQLRVQCLNECVPAGHIINMEVLMPTSDLVFIDLKRLKI